VIDAVAPDFSEAFVGWRVWIVVAGPPGVRLRSVVQRTIWPVRKPLVAECRRSRPFATLLRRPPHGPAPVEDCRCGIYATRLAELEPLLAEAPWETGARVLGDVSLWGDVVEHERGWRAGFAYPARLYVPVRDGRRPRLTQDEIVAGLADYGVEVGALDCRPSQAVAARARERFRQPRRSSAA
jgi:hypothetical protein